MVPLLPMSFKFATWDQGEADAKRTSSDYYATEFPKMIEGSVSPSVAPFAVPFVPPSFCAFILRLCASRLDGFCRQA